MRTVMPECALHTASSRSRVKVAIPSSRGGNVLTTPRNMTVHAPDSWTTFSASGISGARGMVLAVAIAQSIPQPASLASWLFHAPTGLRLPLVGCQRLQRKAHPPQADRDTGGIKVDLRDANTGVVARGGQSGE